MIDTSTCGVAPRDRNPTLLPLRSATVLMPSLANNSTQPAIAPARTVIGWPESIRMIYADAKTKLRSAGRYRVRGLSGRPHIHIAEFGKTFCLEELLGYVERGDTESRCSREAQSRCFKGPLGAEHSRR